MRLFKFGIPALVASLLLFWVFRSNDKWDRWVAISPAYLATAEHDLSSLEADTRGVAFCFSIQNDATIQVAENCQPFLLRHPHQAACAVQNLNEGKWNSDILTAEPLKAATAIHDMSAKFQCKTIVLDFESLKRPDRDRFSHWVKIVASKLHGDGLYLSIAVHAKTDDAGTWDGPAAQDWPALCVSADELLLMAYDYHFPSSTAAGEQAPLDWVEKVLRYARSTCSTAHLRLGLASYGYKWPTNAVITERELNPSVGAMPESPYFVETAKARELKMSLARSFGVKKVFLWAMGMTAPQ